MSAHIDVSDKIAKYLVNKFLWGVNEKVFFIGKSTYKLSTMHTKSNGILMLSLGALYIFDTHPIKKPTLKYHIGLLRCRKIELQKNKNLLLTIPLMRIDNKIDCNNCKDYSIAPVPILGLTMSALEDEDFVDSDNEEKNDKNIKKEKKKSKNKKKKVKNPPQEPITNGNENNGQETEVGLNDEENAPQVIIDIPDITLEDVDDDLSGYKNATESEQFENLLLADEQSNLGTKGRIRTAEEAFNVFQSSEPVQDEYAKKSGTESDSIQPSDPKKNKKGKTSKKKINKNKKQNKKPKKAANDESPISYLSFQNDDEKEEKDESSNENSKATNFQDLVEVSDQESDNQSDDSDSSEDDKNNNNKQKLSKIKEIVIKINSSTYSKFLFKTICKILSSILYEATNIIRPKFKTKNQKIDIVIDKRSKDSLPNRAILVSHYCFSRGESLECADYLEDKWNGQPLFVIGPSFHPGGYGVPFGCAVGLESSIKAVVFKRAHFEYLSAFLSSLLISSQDIKTIGFTEYPRDKEIPLKFIRVKKTTVNSWILLNCCSSMIKSFAKATDGLPKPVQSLKIGRYSYNKNDANEVFLTIAKKKNLRKMLQLSLVTLNFKEFPQKSFTTLCTSLTKLEELEISRVNIDGSIIFKAVYSDAPHIRQLVMNGLRFEQPWSIKERMNLPSGLILLDLSESYFTDSTLADLFQNITYKVSKIPFFFLLRSIQFTETVFPAFESPEFDLKLCQPNILEFDMSGNSFPSNSFESIFRFIATQKRIRNLIFTDVFVDKQRYFVHMLSSVRGCDLLTGIDFSGNFQPVIVQQFISSVSTNRRLKRLSVKNSGALNKGFEIIENLLNMVKGLREIELDGFHPEDKVDLAKRHPLILCWDKIRKSKSILANDLPIKDLADLGFNIEKVYKDENGSDIEIDENDEDSEDSDIEYVKKDIKNTNSNFYYKFDERLGKDDKKMFQQLVKPYRSSPSTMEERLGYLYLCIKRGDVKEIKRAISPDIFQILHKNLKPLENKEAEADKEKNKNKKKVNTNNDINNLNDDDNNNKVDFDPDLLKNAISQQKDRSELVTTISALSRTIKMDKKDFKNIDDNEDIEKVENNDSEDFNINILLSDKIDASFEDENSSSDFDEFFKNNNKNQNDDLNQSQINKTIDRSLIEINDDDNISDVNFKLSQRNIMNLENENKKDESESDDFAEFLNQTQSNPKKIKTMKQPKDESDILLKFLEDDSDSDFTVTKKGANAMISKTLGHVTLGSDEEEQNQKKKTKKNLNKTMKPKAKNSKTKDSNQAKNSNNNKKTKSKNKSKNANNSNSNESDIDQNTSNSNNDKPDYDFDEDQNSDNSQNARLDDYDDVDYDGSEKLGNLKFSKNILKANNTDDDNSSDDNDYDNEFGYLRNKKAAQNDQFEFDDGYDNQNPKASSNDDNSELNASKKSKKAAPNDENGNNELNASKKSNKAALNDNSELNASKKSNKASEKRVTFSSQIQQTKAHKRTMKTNQSDDDEIEAEAQQSKNQKKAKEPKSSKNQAIKNSESSNNDGNDDGVESEEQQSKNQNPPSKKPESNKNQTMKNSESSNNSDVDDGVEAEAQQSKKQNPPAKESKSSKNQKPPAKESKAGKNQAIRNSESSNSGGDDGEFEAEIQQSKKQKPASESMSKPSKNQKTENFKNGNDDDYDDGDGIEAEIQQSKKSSPKPGQNQNTRNSKNVNNDDDYDYDDGIEAETQQSKKQKNARKSSPSPAKPQNTRNSKNVNNDDDYDDDYDDAIEAEIQQSKKQKKARKSSPRPGKAQKAKSSKNVNNDDEYDDDYDDAIEAEIQQSKKQKQSKESKSSKTQKSKKSKSLFHNEDYDGNKESEGGTLRDTELDDYDSEDDAHRRGSKNSPSKSSKRSKTASKRKLARKAGNDDFSGSENNSNNNGGGFAYDENEPRGQSDDYEDYDEDEGVQNNKKQKNKKKASKVKKMGRKSNTKKRSKRQH